MLAADANRLLAQDRLSALSPATSPRPRSRKGRMPEESHLQVAIGRAVRASRHRRGATVMEIAAAADISVGMLSKIENGVISPSLATLQALAAALAVPLTTFFRCYDADRAAIFVKAGSGVDVDQRGTPAGHQDCLLGYLGAATGMIVEPHLITLTRETDTLPLFQHDGLEFLYLLEGEVTYRHGADLYPMQPGDSLFFDGDALHGPERLTRFPIRYLSIISGSCANRVPLRRG